MKKIKAVIIDDEKHSVATLAWKLDKFCPDVEVVNQFTDSAEALDYLRDNEPDLLFLDIEMPRLNGFELLEELNSPTIKVIFITAYDEFGIRAVKASALDYLLKPVQNQELKTAIEKYHLTNQSTENATNASESTPPEKLDRIALATKESIEFVEPQDIILCSSDSNYTMIHLSDGRKKLISRTLKDVEEWLTLYSFFRAHHSHLVNLRHIKEYVRSEGGYLVLSNGKTLPVARNRKEALLALI